MPVSVIEIKRSLGSKGISSSVAACCQILPGDSIVTASAVTRATPTSCAAWDFSHETSIGVTDGQSPRANVLVIAQNSTAPTVKREWSTAKAWLYHELSKSSERDEA